MATLQELNQKRWASCKINPNKDSIFASVASRLSSAEAKKRYQYVSSKTGVPWWFIAVVHEREASQKWNTQLGQGDPLNRKSIHIPKGRGPFSTWEEGAIDALVNCAPYAAKNKDWSVGGALAMLEKYNGLGYFKKGIPSPYIWAGTNQYVKGKYVVDGVFNPNAVDSQLGCAGLLKKMNVFGIGADVTGMAVVVGTAGAAAAGYSYWNQIYKHVMENMIDYSIGTALAVALIAGLIIWLRKDK